MKKTMAAIFVGMMVIFLLGGCMAKLQDTAVEEETTEEMTEETAEAATTPAVKEELEKEAPQVDRTSYNKAVFDQEMQLISFPAEFTVNLEEGMKYKVEFGTDAPIQFVVYSTARYNEWKETGHHTISKATTKSDSGCCAAKGVFSFDINQGEAGMYYIVFDDSKLEMADPKPTIGNVLVTKTSNI